MKSLTHLSGLSLVLALSCGSDDGAALDLGPLAGDYDITGPVDDESNIQSQSTPTCILNVTDSHMRTQCSKQFRQASESLEASVSMTSTSMTGDLRYEYSNDSSHDPECFQSYRETIVITGRVDKDSDLAVDGVFGSLAGRWSGSLSVERNYEVELAAGALAECSPEDDVLNYTFSSNVAGASALVSWQGEGTSGSFTVTGTNNSVSVDGDIITQI